MDFKFKTEIINSFLGDCFVITDTSTNKNVEIMKVQVNSILRKYKDNCNSGSFPHGGYDIEGEMITIYHDSERDKHEIEIDIIDLLSILKDGKGAENTNKYINHSDL